MSNISVDSVKIAMRGKAPIVAIPVEGHIPIIIRRKTLHEWAKKLEIRHADYDRHNSRLMLEGVPISYSKYTHPFVRSRCSIIAVPRKEAINELSEWSWKQREKIKGRILLGALDKETSRKLRLLERGDRSGAVEVMISPSSRGAKIPKPGVKVKLPELPDMEFALVLHRDENLHVNWQSRDNDSWTLTEVSTGMSASGGNQSSPEKAFQDGRQRIQKHGAEKSRQVIREARERQVDHDNQTAQTAASPIASSARNQTFA